MAIYRPPALDKANPIVNPVDGRITPYFQRFWQNLSFTAADGGGAAASVAALQSAVSTINGQITVINVALAGKAPLASPALTGNPTAPTQAAGNSSTRLATTAFVAAGFVARNASTGWGAPTGTASKAAFVTYTAPAISAPPTAAEVQAIADHVEVLSQRLKALIDGLLAADVIDV